MSLKVRLIPCLDIDCGQVVKGKKFRNMQSMGDPFTLLKDYNEQDADELIVLDISATLEGRVNLLPRLKSFCQEKTIPLTVGGGIRSLEEAKVLFDNGADRVSLNSILYSNLKVCEQIAGRYGSQAVIASLDFKKQAGTQWLCFKNAGRLETSEYLIEMAKRCAQAGAGELLLTSIDQDGSMAGYDIEAILNVSKAVDIPMIASGGAGSVEHLIDGYAAGATGFLIASKFHLKEWTLKELAEQLSFRGTPVRRKA
jgi:cyclase